MYELCTSYVRTTARVAPRYSIGGKKIWFGGSKSLVFCLSRIKPSGAKKYVHTEPLREGQSRSGRFVGCLNG